MTMIKICGIKNCREVELLNKYLPEYAGFVFAKSRRQVNHEQAKELGAKLDEAIKKVGVFVDEDAELVADTSRRADLSVVQLHGSESKEYIKLLRSMLNPGIEIWKTFLINTGHIPGNDFLNCTYVDRLLLDTYIDGIYGGTGKCFDWSLISQLNISLPIVLAGGLNPDNVKRAIEHNSFYAVDTSSGVETNGIKDEKKMKAFIEAVRGGRI